MSTAIASSPVLRGGLTERRRQGFMYSFQELMSYWANRPVQIRTIRIVGRTFLDEEYTVLPEPDPDAESDSSSGEPSRILVEKIRNVLRLLKDVTRYDGEELLDDGGYVALVGRTRASNRLVCILEAGATNAATYVFTPDSEERPPEQAFWKRSRLIHERPASLLGRAIHNRNWTTNILEAFNRASGSS